MVDGIIMIPASKEGGHIFNIRMAGIPIVLLDRRITGLDFDYVLADNHLGGYLAGKHLVELGHKNIGYIDRKNPHHHSIERKKGFEKALAEKGLDLGENTVRGGFSYKDGMKAARDIMEKNRNMTAVFSFNDINALGAIRGFSDMGLEVPGDISVMGNDDISLSEIFIPRLTTIHYPVKEMVEEAASILLGRIKQPIFRKTKEIVIKPEIVIRESTSARKKL
jgi:LacI family transcriptional regulator